MEFGKCHAPLHGNNEYAKVVKAITVETMDEYDAFPSHRQNLVKVSLDEIPVTITSRALADFLLMGMREKRSTTGKTVT